MLKDNVIRVGGNSCYNKPFIKQLINHLKESGGRNYIVISAISQLNQIIEGQLEHVFRVGVNRELLKGQLESVCEKIINEGASHNYQQLVTKVLQLLEGISLTGDYSSALHNQVLSYSEKLTADIFIEILKEFGAEATILLPEENGFLVSADYGNASHLHFDFDHSSHEDGIFIIPGSYGITENGKIARSGNFAADYTAAALAAWLQVPQLVLWGLDKDFYSADPEIVKLPSKIRRLTYAEASELAYFDHYSIHPRTVEPLEALHLPIHVVSGNDEVSVKETIINTNTYISDTIVKGVAHSDDISLLKLDGAGVGLKPGILAKVTTCLNNEGINIRSVITAQTSINFILTEKDGARALELVKGLGFTSVKEISIVSDISLIGIVGHGLQQHYGVFAKLFGAVAEHKINVLLSGSGASDLVSYLVVHQDDRDLSVQVIHKAFFSKTNENNKIQTTLNYVK